MCLKFSMVLIVQNIQEKVDLEETRVNNTKTRKVCVDRSNLYLGKEWKLYVHLGGMLIIMVRQ